MRTTSRQTRLAGGLALAALSALIVAAALLLAPQGATPEPKKVGHLPTATPSASATASATPSPTATLTPSPTLTLLPTANPEIVGTSIAQSVNVSASGEGEVGVNADPYTINREPQRAHIIQYVVQRGDNLQAIAERYGISLETIIWSNERFYVNAMRPGLELNILPVNGALHRVEEPVTIQALADQYQVAPYTIIDSEYNALADSTPQSILPVGLEVVIPGGIGSTEPVYWDPGMSSSGQASGASESGGVIYQGTAKFGVGQPGSCGVQEIYNGTLPIFKPVYGYVLTTDFSWSHRGVDLSAPIGTTVKAVGAGTVIFAGWSDWGYGWTVVIAHGPLMSLYAHMTGDFVSCGEHVEAGQHIGNVGSSGNSSGPHLHFEVRNAAGVPQNPRDYLPF